MAGLWALSCLSSNAQVIQITSSVVWSSGSPMTITDGIIVKDGGVLEVYDNLMFNQGAGINVEKGGLLVIRGVVLTSSNNSFLWEGITVEGTAGTKILPIENIAPIAGAPHGVVMLESATISNAKIGVSIGNTNNGNVGGLLQGLNTLFVNNGIGVSYNSFGGPNTSESNRGNANYLRKCDFICNQTLNEVYGGANYTKNFILIDGFNGGLTFRGCVFKTVNLSMYDVWNDNITGILCTGGSQNILMDEAETETVNGQTDAGRKNYFESLYRGIYFTTSLTGTSYEAIGSDFRNASFYKVMRCYHFKKSSLFNVDCNTQTVDNNNFVQGSTEVSYGTYYQVQGTSTPTGAFSRSFESCFLWLDECFDYNVRNNTVTWESNFPYRGVGIVSGNSLYAAGLQTCHISGNKFEYSHTETNSAILYGCFFMGENRMAQLRCNIFTRLSRDIALKGLVIEKTFGQLSGVFLPVLSTQGDVTSHCNNTFGDYSTQSGRFNIVSDVSLDYHYFGAANSTNLTYPNWVDFDAAMQAVLTTISNNNSNFVCNATSCVPIIDIAKSQLLGVSTVATKGELKTYPSPSYDGKIFIDFENPIRTLRVMTSLGNEIELEYTQEANKVLLIKDFSAGVYFIQITDKKGQTYNSKFIIAK